MSLRRGQLDLSADAWSAALVIRERIPGANAIELQKVLAGLAHARMSQRRFAESRALVERGLALLRQHGEEVSEAGAAYENLLANVALGAEDFADARVHAERQIQIELELRARGGADQPVTAYAMLGQILQRLDEYEAAEHALREAVRLAESLDGPLQRHALTALVQLSALLNARGNVSEAASFASRAVEVADRELGATAPNVVPALNSLLDAERAQGNLAQALQLAERAAPIVSSNAGSMQRAYVARFHRSYGELLLELGERAAAESELRASSDISSSDPTLSIEKAATLVMLARLTREENPAAAREQLQEARSIYSARLPETHPLALRVVDELCALELQTPKDSLASCAEAQARLARTRFAEPVLRQSVLQRLSERAYVEGRTADMQSLALESLAAALTSTAPDAKWRANFQLARALNENGDRRLSIFFGKEAVDIIQGLRRSLLGVEANVDQLFVRDKIAVYRTVADWLMTEGRFDEALEVLDLLKGEELAQFLVRAAADAPARPALSRTTAESKWIERYSELAGPRAARSDEIDELSRRRALQKISRTEATELENLLSTEQALEPSRLARLTAFVSESQRVDLAGTGNQRQIQVDRLAREVRRLGRHSALAVYLLTDKRLRILVATRSRQQEFTVDLDAGELRLEIGAFLEGIAQRQDILPKSRRLYDLLLRPVDQLARAAGVRRLVLWPDDALRYVPFAALHDGKQYTMERMAIQMYGESPATELSASVRSNTMSVRGFGITRSVGGYAALPAVAEELCSVVGGPIRGLASGGANCQTDGLSGDVRGVGLLPGEGFANASFTEQQLSALLRAPRSFSVLHMGTHFSLRPGNALRSFLLMGDGGKLTLDRLAVFDFTGVALLTLSGCQTALGGARTEDGREVEGLSALLQRRGAASVLASLWQVEDYSTSVLMREFYRRQFGDRETGAEALRQAQWTVMHLQGADGRRYEHPYFWAGFNLASSRL
jgi:CHAT domain-containing protein